MTILRFYLLPCLLTLTACQPQDIQKNWSKFRYQLQKEPKSSEYRRPPRELKPFSPLEDPQIEVLSSFSTQDRFGQKRLQLYLLTKTEPDEALLKRVSAKYQNYYTVIWIYIVNSKQHFYQQQWDAQAAWFSPKIPLARHYIDFKKTGSDQRFYWYYE